jgi:hypothetical protein
MNSVSQDRDILSFPKIELSSYEDEQAAGLWDFPSDHLPVCAQVNQYRFGSFNILNTKFIDIIINPEKNKGRPGWSASPLAKMQAVPSQEKLKISEREKQVCDIIQAFLLEKNEHATLDLLCLQECSNSMIELLREKLENRHFEIISGNGGQNNDVAIIVNTSIFSIEEKLIEVAFKRQTNSLGLVPDTYDLLLLFA